MSVATAGPRLDLMAHRFSLWIRLGAVGAATFDAEGRLLTARLGRRYLRRGLDRSFVELTRDPGGPWPWTVRRLGSEATPCAELRESLTRLLDSRLGAGERRLVERATSALADEYRGDAAEFAAAVGPVPIVPPNHARSVVVRLTEGCQYNACKFCTLYTTTPFRVRGRDEFRAHVRRVLAYFGDGAGVRPSLWVGDASALEAGVDPFCGALEVLHEEVQIGLGTGGHFFKGTDPRRFDGVYAFADVPRASRLTAMEVARLASLGVRRLYLGVESGHAPLIKGLAKPHTGPQVVEAVRRLHQGGIGAGIILMVGAGGRAVAGAHLADTVRLVGGLGLDDRDFVFLSPLDAHSRANRDPVAGDDPFPEAELAREVGRLRSAIRQAVAPQNLRIADYQLDAFVY